MAFLVEDLPVAVHLVDDLAVVTHRAVAETVRPRVIVEVCDPVPERVGRVRRRIDVHDADVLAHGRRMQAKPIEIEIREAVILVRHAAQRAVQPIGPPVIRADDSGLSIPRSLQHFATPVSAHVVECTQRAVGVAYHEQRVIHEPDRHEVAGFTEPVDSTRVHPRLIEQRTLLALEPGRVKVRLARQQLLV